MDAGAAFTGNKGNDSYVAAYNATASANTLGGLDVLNGGDGTDALEITNDTGAFTLPAATISSIAVHYMPCLNCLNPSNRSRTVSAM